ncbi:MAG: formate dehydrogenase accessory sulfurtransferase FdhD [Marinicaulis sp.]|nr:formate dehydrogenase accessory sulfurtransferase FdhD [Marinicaulis sp.]NNE42064.1 formate dehydrogenase accessory sulfurtransferase FdhD [Marinicaulis sp.]NNL90527.1 formate dehydrogenase accessory sulfurtransferase FdhD [Marinicaulis sp.]
MFPVNETGAPPPTDVEHSVTDGKWAIPEETPVAIVYNRRNYAVMLATPQDITDFAVGFSLTEKIVDSVDEIKALDINWSDRGADLRLKIEDARLKRLDVRQRRRTLPGNVGCGLCGLENADELFDPLPRVTAEKISLKHEAVAAAFASLGDHQPINNRTRTVHAAAWANLYGDIQLAREDVGRHNALDKLLGAMALAGADMKGGFVVLSSRCSYELVQKSAALGVTALATISAPTDFALRKAAEANMALYARGPDGVVDITG